MDGLVAAWSFLKCWACRVSIVYLVAFKLQRCIDWSKHCSVLLFLISTQDYLPPLIEKKMTYFITENIALQWAWNMIDWTILIFFFTKLCFRITFELILVAVALREWVGKKAFSKRGMVLWAPGSFWSSSPVSINTALYSPFFLISSSFLFYFPFLPLLFLPFFLFVLLLFALLYQYWWYLFC